MSDRHESSCCCKYPYASWHLVNYFSRKYHFYYVAVTDFKEKGGLNMVPYEE